MNVFVFFLIMPKFAPFTCCYEHSTFFCCFFSLIQLMYFLSPPFFYIFPPLFGLSWPTFTSFLRLLSISPLTHPVSLDHAFHYSAASIDLLSGWSAIDHNACSSATELRRCCCARKLYIQTRGWSLKTHCALRLLLLFFFFWLHFISLQTFGNTLPLFFSFSSCALSLHLSIHRQIDWLCTTQRHVFMCNSSTIVLELIAMEESELEGLDIRRKPQLISIFFPGEGMPQNKPWRCLSTCVCVCVRAVCWEPHV